MNERVIDKAESQDHTDYLMPPSALMVQPGVPQPPTIGAILSQAVDKGMDPAALEKLVSLYKQMAELEAKRHFDEAMCAFRSSCPPIPRRTENSQFSVTRDGVKVARKYASLDDIAATIRVPLADHGLSYRWGDSIITEGRMTLTCIVSHSGGHSVSSAVTLPVDSKAGCSEQQKYGAAGTYAQRYSLIQALGLTSCDEDDDGNAGTPVEPISEHQAANLQALMDEVKADKGRFLDYFGCDKIADLPAARFKEAVAMLERKRGQR